MWKRFQDYATQWLVNDYRTFEFPLCDFQRIRYELRPSDVILIEGRSRVGDMIRLITQSPWTHSALYVGRLHDIDSPMLRDRIQSFYQGPPDQELIIEGMMGQGTIVSPLSTYEHDHIRICRPIGISRADAQNVIAYTIQKLGTGYDVRQIFDLGRFFFPWGIIPRKWRSSIFSHHPGSYTKTVCSTVIAEAFASVSFPILPKIITNESEELEVIPRNPRLYTPKDFDYSPYFEIIKHPPVEYPKKGLYRKLPWKETHMSNDHQGVLACDTLPQKTTSEN